MWSTLAIKKHIKDVLGPSLTSTMKVQTLKLRKVFFISLQEVFSSLRYSFIFMNTAFISEYR